MQISKRDWGHSIIAKEFELALFTTTRERVLVGTCGLGIGFLETLEVGEGKDGGDDWEAKRWGKIWSTAMPAGGGDSVGNQRQCFQ